MFDTCGFLVIPDAMSAEAAAACLAASERVHEDDAFIERCARQSGSRGEKFGADPRRWDYESLTEGAEPEGKWPETRWRQLDNAFEIEPALEELIDHPPVIDKVRSLFGDTFILHSSWNTLVPSGFRGGGLHQDGGVHSDVGSYSFHSLGNGRGLAGDGGPVPLVLLRIGWVLTDLSEPGAGNLVFVPGSHNTRMALPPRVRPQEIPIAQEICATPGTAILFHQGVCKSSRGSMLWVGA